MFCLGKSSELCTSLENERVEWTWRDLGGSKVALQKGMLLQLLFKVMCRGYHGNMLKESLKGAQEGGYRKFLLYVCISPPTCSTGCCLSGLPAFQGRMAACKLYHPLSSIDYQAWAMSQPQCWELGLPSSRSLHSGIGILRRKDVRKDVIKEWYSPSPRHILGIL